MDAIDAFDQFFVIAHRSPTLDGDMQTRAVQYCPPMVEGTAAGFQVVSPAQIVLNRTKSGTLRVSMGDAVLARVARQEERVDRLVELGLLERDGAWHRLLRERLYWGDGDVLHLWTGHLVRPRPGVALYLTSSFNRRCATTAKPLLFEGRDWVPLVLSLSVPPEPGAAVWLKGDVACLLPVSAGATFVKHTLSESPEVGDQFNAYFDRSYWDKNRKPARYRELVKGERMQGPPEAACKLVYGGPDLFDIGPLAPVASATQIEPTKARSKTSAATLRSITSVNGTCDGHLIMCKRGPLKKRIAAFHEQWGELYGKEAVDTLPSLSSFLFPSPQGRRELLLRPWVFVVTPEGWSTVIDGEQLPPRVEGLRGVMSTDKHFSPPLVFRIQENGPFAIPRGAALAKLIPIPRQLLRTTFAVSSLDDLDARAAAAL
jgi:hypothetical protein